MAIQKGHRFPIEFDAAFGKGLVLVGEIAPDFEYQENKNKEPRQKIDPVTGKRQWVGTVTDPDETKAKRASFQVTFLADVQPVPPTAEVLPGMRPIELDGLTVEARVSGSGEFKYQGWLFRATGFKAAGSGANRPQAKAAEAKGADGSKAA